MSNLPAGWQLVPLGKVVKPRRERATPTPDDERPYVGLEHVEAQTTRLLGVVPAASMKSTCARFFPTDVIYGRLRPYLNKVCMPGIEGLCSAEFIVFPDQPEVLRSAYLKYRLNTSDFVRFANSLNAGDRPRVDFEQLSTFEIELPPPDVQASIVAKLDELLSDLDAGIANIKRAQVNLKRYRSAVLTAAVEGHLTVEWRNQNSPTETGEQYLARILNERRAKWEADQLAKFAMQGKIPPKGWQSKYVEPASPDTTELPELPAGWRWMSLRQITEPIQHSVKAGPFGSALKKELFTSTGYKVYGQEQVIRGDAYYGDYFIDEEKYQELRSCRVKPGDLLISLVGTIGRTLVLPPDAMPGIINPRLIKLTLEPNVVSPEFIQLYFASPFVKSIFKLASHGGTMEILNMGILEALPFPIPPLDEQRQIVLTAEDVTSNIMRTEEEITSQLSKAASLRQAILKSAFSGKLLEESSRNQAASEAAA